MSHWNHRVFKEPDEDWFTIREVYYNDNGDIVAYTGAKDVSGENVESLRTTLNWMLNCLDKPILVESEIKLADFDDTDNCDGTDDEDMEDAEWLTTTI